jgi:hypothetical protein
MCLPLLYLTTRTGVEIPDSSYTKTMFRVLLFLLTGLLALVASPMTADTDMPVEKAYLGIVSKVTQHTCEVCKQIEVSVVLKTSKGKVEIKLGPKPFLEEHAFVPVIGDELSVVGVMLPENNGKQAVFANEIGKGGAHLVLRGKFGRPEWLGPHGETCAKCGI